ncbi:unnamed protein product [Malus baccata var. baccata]
MKECSEGPFKCKGCTPLLPCKRLKQKHDTFPYHIHYSVNSKSIPYHQGRTYSRFDGLVLTLKFLSRPYTLKGTRKPSSTVQE